MKHLSPIALAITLACTGVTAPVFAKTQSQPQQASSEQVTKRVPKIQVAILLDTSNSMDGLINQTRQQLWQVVNEFSSAKQNGVKPILEVALFEYGNDNLARNQGFIRKLNGFTQELDLVSEGLFSLRTNGGSEYCGFAIQSAVNQLQWSSKSSDIKTIFIAGNEPFTQGPVNYKEAIAAAKKQGITVNTIHAGDHSTGLSSGWQQGAQLAGGDYMSIDSNQKVVHIDAPQDKKIAQLNAKLNQTYVPYGQKGKEKAQRQQVQDSNNESVSSALLAKRAKSKASSYYKNSSWDLVDAVENGTVSADEVGKMDEKQLPTPMKTMNPAERKDYVEKKAKERKALKEEIVRLSEERETYVAAERAKKPAAAAPTMSEALTQSVKKQAQDKNFVLKQPEHAQN